jgi:hypothetical protein
MRRYMQWCPSCDARFDPKTAPILSAHSFSCPFCGAPLRIAADHMGIVYVISLIFSVFLTFHLGFRGFTFALIAIPGSGLIFLASYAIIGLVRPARVELRPPSDSSLRLPNGPRK